jgi:hypothetical protein
MGDPIKSELVKVGSVNIEALRARGSGWVAVSLVCDALGIDARSQRRRIESSAWADGVMMTLTATASDGKQYDMFCIRYDRVAIWLATMETRRVKSAEARLALADLQREAADVLDRWFRGTQPPAPAIPPLRWTAEDPLEMFEYALQSMKRTRAEIAQVAATQAEHSARLALVENKQRTAAREIEPISPAQPELPGISKRQLVREHVNRYAAAMNMSQQDVWRLLYHYVDRRLGTRVYAYALAKGETKLDRLEKLGLLDKVGKVCDAELQIPEERLRQLAAPAKLSAAAQLSGMYDAY